mmetsp:Transcript_23582/g.58580  ORF Transcript_23582/g.58580 Transcript_23582/m.58580 type:complete len:152 (+) Transcript_23582:181-636(+)
MHRSNPQEKPQASPAPLRRLHAEVPRPGLQSAGTQCTAASEVSVMPSNRGNLASSQSGAPAAVEMVRRRQLLKSRAMGCSSSDKTVPQAFSARNLKVIESASFSGPLSPPFSRKHVSVEKFLRARKAERAKVHFELDAIEEVEEEEKQVNI